MFSEQIHDVSVAGLCRLASSADVVIGGPQYSAFGQSKSLFPVNAGPMLMPLSLYALKTN
jgi:hypothetical protein